MRNAMQSCRCAFEAMEPRLTLAATGAFVSAAADPTSLTVVVDYTGVNQATIGAGDITFSSGNRGAVAAASVLSTQPRPLGVLRVTYSIPAYDGAWGVTDTGTYTIASPPGQVMDITGHNLAFSNLASQWLWFSAPKARVLTYSVSDTAWFVSVQYDTLGALDESTLDGNDLAMTGGTPSSRSVAQIVHLSPTSTQVVYALGAPGGAWSYASTGTYTVSLAGSQVADQAGRQATGHLMASYWLWFNAPRAEYVGHAVGGSNWTVSVRFSPGPGTAIDPASLVPDGVVMGVGPQGYFESGHLNTFINNSDGSYTVTYSLVANGGSWDWTDSGLYTVRMAVGRAQDLNGNFVGGGDIGSSTLTFTAPAAAMVLPTHPTPTQWNIAVDFSDDVALNMQSINAASVRLQGPDGTDVPLSLVSVIAQSPSAARATFRLTTPGGMLNGNYRVIVNDQGALDTAGNGVAENVLASFWIWF